MIPEDWEKSAAARMWQAVFQPERDFMFDPQSFPMGWPLSRPDEPAFLAQCHALAQFCHLSYLREPEERQRFLARVGCEERAFGTERELLWTRIRSLNDPVAGDVICFRGTSDPRHWAFNANTLLISWSAGGRVHLGFSRAFKLLQKSLTEELNHQETRPLVFLGHSLGGALALLAATLIHPQSVVTFGAPRPGNSVFAEVVESICPIYRIVNGEDLVPALPSKIDLLDRFAYAHAGKLVRLQEGRAKPLLKESLYALMERDQLGEPLPALLHHAPSSYVSQLARETAS